MKLLSNKRDEPVYCTVESIHVSLNGATTTQTSLLIQIANESIPTTPELKICGYTENAGVKFRIDFVPYTMRDQQKESQDLALGGC